MSTCSSLDTAAATMAGLDALPPRAAAFLRAKFSHANQKWEDAVKEPKEGLSYYGKYGSNPVYYRHPLSDDRFLMFCDDGVIEVCADLTRATLLWPARARCIFRDSPYLVVVTDSAIVKLAPSEPGDGERAVLTARATQFDVPIADLWHFSYDDPDRETFIMAYQKSSKDPVPFHRVVVYSAQRGAVIRYLFNESLSKIVETAFTPDRHVVTAFANGEVMLTKLEKGAGNERMLVAAEGDDTLSPKSVATGTEGSQVFVRDCESGEVKAVAPVDGQWFDDEGDSLPANDNLLYPYHLMNPFGIEVKGVVFQGSFAMPLYESHRIE